MIPFQKPIHVNPANHQPIQDNPVIVEDAITDCYNCDRCDLVCNNFSDLQKHKSLDSYKCGQVYACGDCKFKSCGMIAMNSHRTENHTKFKCSECTLKISSQEVFEYHSQYQCKMCDSYKGCTLDGWKNHMVTVHNKPKHSLIHEFECQKCHWKSVQKADLWPHFNAKEVHKCDICGFKSCVSDKITEHKNLEHAKKKPIIPQTKPIVQMVNGVQTVVYSCDKCSCRYRASDGLQQHLVLSQQEQGPYPCDVCTFKSCTQKGLNFHKNVAHGIKAQPGQQKLQNFPTQAKQEKVVKEAVTIPSVVKPNLVQTVSVSQSCYSQKLFLITFTI